MKSFKENKQVHEEKSDFMLIQMSMIYFFIFLNYIFPLKIFKDYMV